MFNKRLSKRQKSIREISSYLVATIILIGFIIFGVHNAQRIDRQGRARWHQTTGAIVRIGPRFGVTQPSSYKAQVAYEIGGENRKTEITVNAPGTWRVGDQVTMYYDSQGTAYVPADSHHNIDPYPVGEGAAWGWIILGLLVAIVAGLLAAGLVTFCIRPPEDDEEKRLIHPVAA